MYIRCPLTTGGAIGINVPFMRSSQPLNSMNACGTPSEIKMVSKCRLYQCNINFIMIIKIILVHVFKYTDDKKIEQDSLDSTVTNKPFFETMANILLSENVMLE